MTYLRLRPCYDGGRHRWVKRSDWWTGRGRTPRHWCQRCGNWRTDLNIRPSSSEASDE